MPRLPCKTKVDVAKCQRCYCFMSVRNAAPQDRKHENSVLTVRVPNETRANRNVTVKQKLRRKLKSHEWTSLKMRTFKLKNIRMDRPRTGSSFCHAVGIFDRISLVGDAYQHTLSLAPHHKTWLGTTIRTRSHPFNTGSSKESREGESATLE